MPKQQCISMLKALADETRWEMVQVLLSRPCTVGELAEALQVPHYNASKHAKILKGAGIVTTEKSGKTVKCRIADEFQRKLSKNQNTLDLGCCTFRFDRVKSFKSC